MKISKASVRNAVNNGDVNGILDLLEDAGATIVDGVSVRPGMTVKAVGFKNAKTFVIAPKGSGPIAKRTAGAISVYRTDGTITFVRRSQFTVNGKACGLFYDGQPVIGYAS